MAIHVLNEPTLVLNRSWQPIQVSTVARALVMLWNNAARVVDTASYQLYDWDSWIEQPLRDDESMIRSATLTLRPPEVIALARFDGVPSTNISFSRRNVFKRDRFTCQYCGVQPESGEATLDHVMPRARGGDSSWENCVTACLSCNSRKADRTPEEAGMRLRVNPMRPSSQPFHASHPKRMQKWSQFFGHKSAATA